MKQENKITDSNGIAYKNIGGTFYHYDTFDNICTILETVKNTHERIRVHYGDTKTGKDWNEQHHVTGYIERSTGSIKIPLLIYNERSIGGPALLDHCIVKITTTKGKKLLYQHHNYHQ